MKFTEGTTEATVYQVLSQEITALMGVPCSVSSGDSMHLWSSELSSAVRAEFARDGHYMVGRTRPRAVRIGAKLTVRYGYILGRAVTRTYGLLNADSTKLAKKIAGVWKECVRLTKQDRENRKQAGELQAALNARFEPVRDLIAKYYGGTAVRDGENVRVSFTISLEEAEELAARIDPTLISKTS